MITNLNDLAKRVTLKEGKKLNLSIAQVKEVMRILFSSLTEMKFKDVVEILNRYR
jgi:predicted DNA-binding antitoxin AbrB/MazE fold protein